MSKVEMLIGRMGRRVHTAYESMTVFEAIGRMVKHNVGSLVVTDEEGELRGIITERDYLRRVALEGRSSKTTFVQEIMSSTLVCVEPSTEVEDCMRLMTEHRIRHLPVVSGRELVGIVSMGDIVSHLATERETTIRELTGYIQGRYA